MMRSGSITKRIAIILTAVMILTAVPFCAFADNEIAGDQQTAGSCNGTAKEGRAEVQSEPADPGQPGVPTNQDQSGDSADQDQPEEPADPGQPGEPTDPEQPEPQDPQDEIAYGWNEDKTVYTKEDGTVMADCVAKIDGTLYYFNAEGFVEAFSGWKTVGDAEYWADASGKIANSATQFKVQGKKKRSIRILYYNKKKHKWQKKRIRNAKMKPLTIEENATLKELYLFGSDGKLVTKKGLFEFNGQYYYGVGNGQVKTGWVAVGNKAMYFYPKTGIRAKNTRIGHLRIPKKGYLGKAYALGINQMNKTGWTLKSAFVYSASLKYKDKKYRAKNSEKYAIRGFTKHYGNCFVMAATFYIQAKLLGYDVHQIKGKIRRTHSWTEIKQNGKIYVYDPDCTHETGRNAFKIRYGKKGTLKYNHYRRMN